MSLVLVFVRSRPSFLGIYNTFLCVMMMTVFFHLSIPPRAYPIGTLCGCEYHFSPSPVEVYYGIYQNMLALWREEPPAHMPWLHPWSHPIFPLDRSTLYPYVCIMI